MDNKDRVRFYCKNCDFRFRKRRPACNFSIMTQKNFTRCPKCRTVCVEIKDYYIKEVK